jgi:hypothetical protein
VAISARHAANVEVHGSSQLARAAAKAILVDMRLIIADNRLDLDFSRRVRFDSARSMSVVDEHAEEL